MTIDHTSFPSNQRNQSSAMNHNWAFVQFFIITTQKLIFLWKIFIRFLACYFLRLLTIPFFFFFFFFNPLNILFVLSSTLIAHLFLYFFFIFFSFLLMVHKLNSSFQDQNKAMTSMDL